MAEIRSLFDAARALNRPIEKVITYQHRSDKQLRAEISEYVATQHIVENFDRLLKLMQAALHGGGGHEIGVWVSGFYGSGKSSFTKYLGFALDRNISLEGEPFLRLLQNQVKETTTRALFNQVAATYDPVVIFLDLASEMLAGASMEDISTVLYLKVLQWAGYSEDLKVAELERMLEADGKLDEFQQRAADELDGIPWADAHNQPLVANQIAARLASEFYPRLFPQAADFGQIALHVTKSEFKRAEEMVELIRRRSGRKNILFVVDEVGQYVAPKPNLILNLDGLAKNLKEIGGGQVWLFATAQQTLTEDNPSAMLNAPGLSKLKDRFPIQIHLEASDIKEICHTRLLTKSADGQTVLGQLFASHGASLRTATQLHDAGVYESALDRDTFIKLYPFLPAHFEMLLQLLGRLARRTGGLGLRSAIKVLQDVLIDRAGRPAHELTLAEAPVGSLANTVTFYDSLRRDIQTSYSYIIEGVERVAQRFPANKLALDVAKSIAILQILENLPVTVQNIAALLHASVDAPSQRDAVANIVTSLLGDTLIPLGEKNGSLRFLTQAAVTLQKQFDLLEYRNADLRAEQNNALRALVQPLPSARLASVRPVTAGLRAVVSGGQSASLEGEKEAIQMHVEFVPGATYDTTRTERENDSRSSRDRSTIFLLGRIDAEAERLAVTLVRCRKFVDQYRNTTDLETKEFVRVVSERLDRTSRDLETRLQTALFAGSFIAHGAQHPVAELGSTLGDAARAFLGTVAARVFDRYAEAAVQADTAVAEKFLKTPMDRLTNADDPLGLISRATAGRTQVRTTHKALVSIKDYLGQNSEVEGRRLLDHFSEPPFGWSKDTTRYLIAAAFLAGEIKLRISGQDHVVKDDETLKVLASNKALAPIGISLRQERPDPEALFRASERLRELTGENILPLEPEIAAAAKKAFPTYQQAFGSLGVELRSLNAAGAERADDLAQDLTAVVSGDGSDAVRRFGGMESPLYESILWARRVKRSLDLDGLRVTISHLQMLQREIGALPDTGAPGELKIAATTPLAAAADILKKETFHEEFALLRQMADQVDKRVSVAVDDLAQQQKKTAQEEIERWETLPEWRLLADNDQRSFREEASGLTLKVTPEIDGLRRLLAQDYDLNHRLRDLGRQVIQRAGPKPEPVYVEEEDGAYPSYLPMPADFHSVAEIQALIETLKKLIEKVRGKETIHIRWKGQ